MRDHEGDDTAERMLEAVLVMMICSAGILLICLGAGTAAYVFTGWRPPA